MANNKPRNTERDAAMIADFEAGLSKAEIARKNGVSRQRASKIINSHQNRELAMWQAQNEFLLKRIESVDDKSGWLVFSAPMSAEEILAKIDSAVDRRAKP